MGAGGARGNQQQTSDIYWPIQQVVRWSNSVVFNLFPLFFFEIENTITATSNTNKNNYNFENMYSENIQITHNYLQADIRHGMTLPSKSGHKNNKIKLQF